MFTAPKPTDLMQCFQASPECENQDVRGVNVLRLGKLQHVVAVIWMQNWGLLHQNRRFINGKCLELVR
jgi:hypothetical protein